MKFTLSWLKRHLDTSASLQDICETLTAIGLEVDGVEDRAKDFAPFKVAYVEKAEPHPDADRLQVCTVKTENGSLQVVCGAPNARTGMKAIFAPEGTYIPGLDITLKKTKIRGVESNGMLVSEREMCLSDEHEGIIDLDGAFEIGTPMADVFGLNDPVIEISLTPNRADCTGVRGIARDLAAAGLGTLEPLDTEAIKGTFDCPVSITIDDQDGCPHFIGRVIKNIENKPSPQWLQDLLKAVGLRPISALVDITNFMSLDHARPLHVYDADKLSGNLRVAATKGGEKLDALNDKTYEVVSDAAGIYDDSGLIGLGGIVGGTTTAVDENTKNVFIEAAYFSPSRIARTGRDLGAVSDARYRFERGVDPAFTQTGMEIATKLVLELCAGDKTEISHLQTAGTEPDWRRTLTYNPALMKNLIGLDIETQRQKDILAALGFELQEQKNGMLGITPPSWRGDIDGKADITEEVIRMVGFDSIPSFSVRSSVSITHNPETVTQARARKTRRALCGRGLDECVTWSFMKGETATLFGANDDGALTLVNPISAELDHMRPSILANLVDAAGRNHNLGTQNTALFEIGPVFRTLKPDGQEIIAAGLRAGHIGDKHWDGAHHARAADMYDAKADALATLEACDAPASNAQVTRDAPSYYHPGRSGALRLGKNVLAYFGEIHPAVLQAMDIEGAVCGFEVFLQNIPVPKKKSGNEKPLLLLEPLQAVNRDFAFLLDESVEADTLIRAAASADKKLIKDVYVFDVYTGKGIDEGKKSVAINVTIQPQDATLTDKDLDSLAENVIQAVQNKTGGVLRG